MPPNTRITLGKSGHIELFFPYAETKNEVRVRFRGGLYDWPCHCWKVPYSRHNLQTAEEWAQRYSLQIGPERWLSDFAYQQEVLQPLYRESFALDPQKALGPITDMRGTLYPFQQTAIQYALNRKRCLIADTSGAGKTVVALATIAKVRAFPLIIVSPPALLPHWENEIASWFPTWSVQLLKGQSLIFKQRAYIVGYSQLEKYGPILEAMWPRSIVFDESHCLKGYQTQQTKLSYELAKRIDYRLLLTGTPVINRPADLMSQLKIMGRWDVLIDVRTFSETYCGAWYAGGDTSPTGAANLSKLEEQLRIYCMIRRTQEQLSAYLPERKVTPVYLRSDPQINNLWNGWFRSSASDVQELRRNAYEIKRGAVIEWLEAARRAEGKTVVFGYHTEYVRELAGIFSGPLVTGENTPQQIQKAIQSFRDNSEAKLLFLTYGIGSQGWQLDAADRVVMVELDWSDSTYQRAEGRLSSLVREKPIRVYRLLARGTYEDHMLRIIEEKRTTGAEIMGE